MSIFLGIFCHFCRWSFRCGSSPMIKKRTVVVRGKRYHLSTLFCTTSLSVFLDAGRTTTARNYGCDILLPLLSSFPKSSFFRCCASLPSKRFRKSSSQKNYAFLSYDVYMTYITSRDISRESREATDQSERLNKYGSHRCFLPGRIGRKRLCRRLSFFGPRTLTVTLPKPLWLKSHFRTGVTVIHKCHTRFFLMLTQMSEASYLALHF